MAPGDVCPVDHKTRELWLEQARAQAEAQRANGEAPSTPLSPHPPHPPHSAAQASSISPPPPSPPASSQPQKSGFFSGWPSLWASAPAPSPPQSSQQPQQSPTASSEVSYLGTDRIVSSIPRTTPADGDSYGSAAPGSASASASASASTSARPGNHEVETGADPVSGNWVYPSEKMFFDAMKRKGNDNARPTDMRVVVPIHNAVNERAWKEILEWEAPYTGTKPGQCGGPRLHSFAGLSTSMTPRARFNTLLGYSAPFDRHDWVVDRCGTQIEYVIDFYAGRPGSNASGQKPGQPQINFYLDVRPKLNSWEGIKMRALRGLGLQ